MEKSDYRYRARSPQSVVSDTLPNQTVDLSVLVKQLMDGQALNVGLSLSSDASESFDDLDVSKLDLRHMTLADVDKLIGKVAPVVEPMAEANGDVPTAD